MLPIITTPASNSAAERTCCGSSTTCACSIRTSGGWRAAARVHRIYERAVAYRGTTHRARHQARRRFEQHLERCCTPWADQPAAVQRKLCARILRHLEELFGFVAEPMVPPTTTAPSAACATRSPVARS